MISTIYLIIIDFLPLSYNASYASLSEDTLSSSNATGDVSQFTNLKYGDVFKEKAETFNTACGTSSPKCIVSCSCNNKKGWYSSSANLGSSFYTLTTKRKYAGNENGITTSSVANAGGITTSSASQSLITTSPSASTLASVSPLSANSDGTVTCYKKKEGYFKLASVILKVDSTIFTLNNMSTTEKQFFHYQPFSTVVLDRFVLQNTTTGEEKIIKKGDAEFKTYADNIKYLVPEYVTQEIVKRTAKTCGSTNNSLDVTIAYSLGDAIKFDANRNYAAYYDEPRWIGSAYLSITDNINGAKTFKLKQTNGTCSTITVDRSNNAQNLPYTSTSSSVKRYVGYINALASAMAVNGNCSYNAQYAGTRTWELQGDDFYGAIPRVDFVDGTTLGGSNLYLEDENGANLWNHDGRWKQVQYKDDYCTTITKVHLKRAADDLIYSGTYGNIVRLDHITLNSGEDVYPSDSRFKSFVSGLELDGDSAFDEYISSMKQECATNGDELSVEATIEASRIIFDENNQYAAVYKEDDMYMYFSTFEGVDGAEQIYSSCADYTIDDDGIPMNDDIMTGRITPYVGYLDVLVPSMEYCSLIDDNKGKTTWEFISAGNPRVYKNGKEIIGAQVFYNGSAGGISISSESKPTCP